MGSRVVVSLLLASSFLFSAPATAVDADFSRLTIRTPQDADNQRVRLTQIVFGSSTLPTTLPQVNGNQLVYPLPLGFRSTAFLHVPAQPNQDLLVYHHGHFDNAAIAAIEQSVLNHFLPAGYSVLFVYMPLYGPNADARYPNPSSHNDFYAQTPNAIRYFLEPPAAFLNYLAPRYRRIIMLGLSGGGWTTALYSALDTRIAKSYPVAGSYPRYITDQVPVSRDIEQYDAAIYDAIDYLDFYAIAGMRHQYQIFNYHDPCCFSGDYGKQYEPAVADVVRPYGGSFSVFVDMNNTEHSISEAAFAVILADLAGQTPFPGPNPAPIPGTIEAENFDNGGEGVAYHDVDALNNTNNNYRTSAVEVVTNSTQEGGFALGWTRAGEWVECTVNVAAAGSYTVDARVASNGVGGTFRIEFDGVDKTGLYSIPDTGAWQNWITLTKTGINLTAGTHVMRISQVANGPTGAIGNINWIRFTSSGAQQTPYPGPDPTSIPGTIEAENFDNGGEAIAYHDVDTVNNAGNVYRAGAVEVIQNSAAEGGFSLGWTRAGEWVEYTVNAASSGSYTVDARVASDGVGGTFHIEFDGVDKTGPYSIPNTGGWQNWATLTKSGIVLKAGTSVMRIVEDANGPGGAIGNINWVRFKLDGPQQTPFPGPNPTPIPGTIEAENFDDGGQGVAYSDVDAFNNTNNNYRATAVEVVTNSAAEGGFSLGWTRAGEWVEYTVNVATAGNYTVEARVASDGVGGTFHVEFDGVDKTGLYSIPNTGGWQNWATLTKTGINLPAGIHIMRILQDANGPTGAIGNINWVRFTATGGGATGP